MTRWIETYASAFGCPTVLTHHEAKVLEQCFPTLESASLSIDASILPPDAKKAEGELRSSIKETLHGNLELRRSGNHTFLLFLRLKDEVTYYVAHWNLWTWLGVPPLSSLVRQLQANAEARKIGVERSLGKLPRFWISLSFTLFVIGVNGAVILWGHDSFPQWWIEISTWAIVTGCLAFFAEVGCRILYGFRRSRLETASALYEHAAALLALRCGENASTGELRRVK